MISSRKQTGYQCRRVARRSGAGFRVDQVSVVTVMEYGFYDCQAVRRRSSLIFSPARATTGACRRPGERVRRSMGPETETAATTRPPGPRTGADTDATPASRSATLAAQPRRRTWASAAAVNLAVRRVLQTAKFTAAAL